MNYLKDTVVKFAIVVLALAALGAGVAVAAGEDDPLDKPAATGADGTQPDRATKEASHQQFLAGVAERLDVSVAELEAAIKAETLKLVDQAVTDGKLTEEQATRLRQAIEEGKARGPFVEPGFKGPGFKGQDHHGARGPKVGPGRHFETLEAAAKYLGLDNAALIRELAAGKSLADLADQEGKSVSGLKQALLSVVEERLDQAVADDRLSEADADAKLEQASKRLDKLIERTHEPRGQRGPMGPLGPQDPPAQGDGA